MITSSWIVLIIFMLLLILVSLFMSFLNIYRWVKHKQDIIEHLSEKEKRKKERRSWQERLWAPMLKLAERLVPTVEKYPLFRRDEQVQHSLVLAGHPMGLNLEKLYALRLALFLIVFVIAWLWYIIGMPFRTTVFLIGPYLAFLYPHIWIKQKGKQRQQQISLDMPSFLDTMSISLRAGASLDGALDQVSKQGRDPLSEEIQRLLHELNLGVPRRQAYENLLKRNHAVELEILVQSLIQGSELGVSVATTFQIQAEDLRSTRGFKAREAAGKASPKITMVTTFLIAPTIFLLIIGLLGLNIMYQPDLFGLEILFR